MNTRSFLRWLDGCCPDGSSLARLNVQSPCKAGGAVGSGLGQKREAELGESASKCLCGAEELTNSTDPSVKALGQPQHPRRFEASIEIPGLVSCDSMQVS